MRYQASKSWRKLTFPNASGGVNNIIAMEHFDRMGFSFQILHMSTPVFRKFGEQNGNLCRRSLPSPCQAPKDHSSECNCLTKPRRFNKVFQTQHRESPPPWPLLCPTMPLVWHKKGIGYRVCRVAAGYRVRNWIYFFLNAVSVMHREHS